MSCTLPSGERAAKLSNLAMLWVYAYDPAGNLLHEAASGSETEAPIIEHIYLGNRLVSSVTGYGSACFIASVAYGTPLSEDLDVFRAFRDKVLTRMTVGQGVINWYYKRGPAGAKWLEGHATAKAATYHALVVVAVPLKAFMFGHWTLYPILFTLCLCAFVVGKRLGLKRSTSLALVFTLAFSTIIVYSFLVDVPVSSASYSERTKYYYTLDHIGRPLNLRDENLYLRWYEQHYPFGEIITEDTPTWDIQAGSGNSEVSWTPHFRFPGQFDDIDQGPFVQNHYREYMPELGRYNRVDPISLYPPSETIAPSYIFTPNPLIYLDFWGLDVWKDLGGGFGVRTIQSTYHGTALTKCICCFRYLPQGGSYYRMWKDEATNQYMGGFEGCDDTDPCDESCENDPQKSPSCCNCACKMAGLYYKSLGVYVNEADAQISCRVR